MQKIKYFENFSNLLSNNKDIESSSIRIDLMNIYDKTTKDATHSKEDNLYPEFHSDISKMDRNLQVENSKRGNCNIKSLMNNCLNSNRYSNMIMNNHENQNNNNGEILNRSLNINEGLSAYNTNLDNSFNSKLSSRTLNVGLKGQEKTRSSLLYNNRNHLIEKINTVFFYN